MNDATGSNTPLQLRIYKGSMMALLTRNSITMLSSVGLITLIFPLTSLAEMLQVSADGTVFLSSDSIAVDRQGRDTFVRGMIYNKEYGRTEAAPFIVNCAPKNGYVQFRKGDGTLGVKNPWSSNGTGVVDAIAITACALAKKVADKK